MSATSTFVFAADRASLIEEFKHGWREGCYVVDIAFSKIRGRDGGKVAYLAVSTPEGVKCNVVEYWADRESGGGYMLTTRFTSEDCGPCENHCPKKILKLLTPTANEWALQWRAECAANLAK